MKKNSFRAAVTFLLLVSIMLVFSIYYLQKASSPIFDRSVGNPDSMTKPEYHFVVIAQNTDDPFWQSVRKGASEASKEFNVAVEFNGPRFTNIEEELQYLDIAIASKVDGIATHVLDEEKFTPIIKKAIESNIPVITVESDAKNSKRLSFIGTNNFQFGAEGGKMIAEATGGKAKIAVVLNSYGSDKGNVIQNLKIAGFVNSIKGYMPDMELITVKSSEMGIFTAGEVTNDIINSYPDVNAIFCTNSKDTIGAAQIIVDLNRVGSIVIVGHGDLPEILRYVEKDVIYGTVVSNPRNMGYESIKALVEIKKKKGTSSYVDTGVYSVTNKNLNEYYRKIEQEKGQNETK